MQVAMSTHPSSPTLRAVPREGSASSSPATLEGIFREHHGAVYRAAHRITGNPSDAEDVLQTVFFRLARREDRDGAEAWGTTVGSYLHRAAVNAALDLVRARKRARAVAIDEVGDSLAEPSAGPEGQRRSREIALRLRAALSLLSPRQAEVFALRYFEGLGNLEISRLLACSQTSIAVILHRARHRLQKELQAFEGGLS